jgi:hypothetical protein
VNPSTLEDIAPRIEAERNNPGFDLLGKLSKGWDYTKSLFGGGKSAAAATPIEGGGKTVVFGDSIGNGLARVLHADASNTAVGMNPNWVHHRIETYRGSLADKDVLISSGASNDVNNAATVTAQIRAAIAKGADPKRIKVLGVGFLASAKGFYPGVSEKVNATLRAAASATGVEFIGLPPGTDVHPDYKALAANMSAPPVAKEPPPGQLAPFTAPAPPAMFHPSLGGTAGHTHISAPTQTIIRVDGAGDPHATARLVHKAQKGVNEDLSETLQGAAP